MVHLLNHFYEWNQYVQNHQIIYLGTTFSVKIFKGIVSEKKSSKIKKKVCNPTKHPPPHPPSLELFTAIKTNVKLNK